MFSNFVHNIWAKDFKNFYIMLNRWTLIAGAYTFHFGIRHFLVRAILCCVGFICEGLSW